MNIRETRLPRLFVAGAVLALVASGCASTPVPQDKMALAQSSIDRAERADATQYAAVQLRQAREKFDAAQKAATAKDGVKAGRLAEEADVDAQLAETVAQSSKSEKAVNDMQESLRVLSEEAQRGQRDATTSGEPK